jgi:tetratricopeptide (TPR) repeat protein
MTHQETVGDGQPPPAVRSSGNPKSRRLRPVLVLAALLLAVGGAGGWYAWQSRNRAEPPTAKLEGVDPEVAAAVTAARSEVLRSPLSAAAWGKYGEVLAAHSYLPEARVCFAAAQRLQPDDARWPYAHGLMLVLSDTDAAIVQFQRAARLRGADPVMRLRLADTLATRGRADEADKHYHVLLDDDALASRAQLGMGRLAYERGDLEAARGLADRAAKDPETRKGAHSLLAEIAQRSDDPEAAARERATVNKLPDDPEPADSVVAEIYRQKVGKHVRMARALKRGRQDRPEDADAEFQDLVRAYPDWDEAWLSYGKFLMEHGAFGPAGQVFRKALSLTPDSVTAHFQLGAALSQQDNFREAAGEFREAVRLKPDYALAYYNLGHCLKRLNDRDGAMAAFREALRIRPDMARARTNLGELLAEQGNKAAAVEELRLALDLNPDDETAKKLRDKLGK